MYSKMTPYNIPLCIHRFQWPNFLVLGPDREFPSHAGIRGPAALDQRKISLHFH